MAEKIKKKLPWFVALGVIVAVLAFNMRGTLTRADDLGTSVTVGNAAPSFDGDAAESTASHNGSGTGDTAGNPTNVGSDVTFQATGDDPNGDDYYLIVCSSDSVSAGTGGGAPSCGDTTYCTSSSTTDETQASCSYTTQAGDSESNAWYAFVCDAASSDQACSSTNQGSGNSGTPFYVNHRPTFTAYSDDTPSDPGATVTWTTTSEDADSDASDDTVTLYVCAASGFSEGSSPGCTGTELCHDGSPGTANSSCTYDIPAVEQDGDYNAYGYVVDNHGFAASGGSQGTDSTMTVSNVAPSISASSIDLLDTDEAENLTLTESQGETQDFLVKFVVTDNNGCQNITSGDEISSAIIHVYRSGVTQSGCDDDGEDDANSCYANAHNGTGGTCVQDTTVNDCTGADDSDVGWRCEFPLQYHADPTVTDSEFSAQNWLVSVQATDDDSSASSLTEDSDGNELGMFMSYDVSETSIGYGSVSAGNDSSEQTTTVEALGNVGLDENLSGTDMTDGGETIAVSQQVYNLSTGEGWTSGTALSADATEVELNCAKTTTTGSPASANTYWYLRVPDGQAAGTYTGTTTVAAVTGESASW